MGTRAWQRGAAAAISLALVLLLCEAAVRLAWRGGPRRLPVLQADARAGWAWRPGADRANVTFGRGSFRFSSDQEGHRITYPKAQPPGINRPEILIVGDSFAAGAVVADEETFAWGLARRVPEVVENLGVVGYGTDQQLIVTEAFFETHPDRQVRDVFVILFDNDFRDVQKARDVYLGHGKPRFRAREGVLERPPYAPAVLDRTIETSRLAWFLSNRTTLLVNGPQPAEDGIEVVSLCLAEMRRLAVRHGARFHSLIYHRIGADPILSSEREAVFLRTTNTIDITEAIRAGGAGPSPLGYDGSHWSAEGHRRALGVILDILNHTGG